MPFRQPALFITPAAQYPATLLRNGPVSVSSTAASRLSNRPTSAAGARAQLQAGSVDDRPEEDRRAHRLTVRILRISKFRRIHEFLTNFKMPINFKTKIRNREKLHIGTRSLTQLFT